MNEPIIEISKQEALERWENEGGEVLPAVSPDVKKATIENLIREKADCVDDGGAKSGEKIDREKNQEEKRAAKLFNHRMLSSRKT